MDPRLTRVAERLTKREEAMAQFQVQKLFFWVLSCEKSLNKEIFVAEEPKEYGVSQKVL